MKKREIDSGLSKRLSTQASDLQEEVGTSDTVDEGVQKWAKKVIDKRTRDAIPVIKPSDLKKNSGS